MIGLAISCRPLNTSLHIQSLQFTSAPCSNTPRKQSNKLKHTILRSTPGTSYFEANQVRHFIKNAEDSIF